VLQSRLAQVEADRDAATSQLRLCQQQLQQTHAAFQRVRSQVSLALTLPEHRSTTPPPRSARHDAMSRSSSGGDDREPRALGGNIAAQGVDAINRVERELDRGSGAMVADVMALLADIESTTLSRGRGAASSASSHGWRDGGVDAHDVSAGVSPAPTLAPTARSPLDLGGRFTAVVNRFMSHIGGLREALALSAAHNGMLTCVVKAKDVSIATLHAKLSQFDAYAAASRARESPGRRRRTSDASKSAARADDVAVLAAKEACANAEVDLARERVATALLEADVNRLYKVRMGVRACRACVLCLLLPRWLADICPRLCVSTPISKHCM
jgi:hypothetical protein